MKKFSVLLTLAVLTVSSSVFAGSIDYLSNQSAKYIMNTASQARTEGADIVAYNPAGTALMGEGFFIDVSNQTLLKYYTEKVEGMDDMEQSEPTLLLPNIYVVYNAGQVGAGKLAVFGEAGIVAGGGSLKWDDGTVGSVMAADFISGYLSDAGLATDVTSSKIKVEGSSVYYKFGIGASYAVLEDMISVSAGIRYVMAERSASFKGVANYYTAALGLAGQDEEWILNIDSEHTYDAQGYTPVFGLDIKPLKELTLGVRYEMETKLEFEYKQDSNTVSHTCSFDPLGGAGTDATLDGTVAALLNKDKKKANRNLPQILSFGAEYVVMPELTVSAGTNIYFVSKADMEKYEDFYGTGYEVSLGAGYKVIDPLKVGATFTYTSQAAKKGLRNSEDLLTVVEFAGNPVLDSVMFGLGATYTVIPNLDITLAGNWVHYLPEDAYEGDVDYEKEVYTIALGAGYKI